MIYATIKKVSLFPSSILAAGLLSGIQLPRIIGFGGTFSATHYATQKVNVGQCYKIQQLNITELSHELYTSLFSLTLVIIRSTKNNTIGIDD